MSTARLTAALAAAVLLAAPAAAVERKIDADGTVHRIEVEPYTCGSRTQGTVLRHVRQAAGGGTQSAVVPGTDDVWIDRDPVLAVDAASGAVLLVWSRQESAGFNLYEATWIAGAWTTPRPLLAPDPDRVRPQVRFGRYYLHVFWLRQSAADVDPQRAVFDLATHALLFGPETLPSSAPPAGTGGSAPEPATGDIYFASGLPGSVPGDPGQVVVWGTRDEPVPFGYVQVIATDGETRGDLQAEASFVHGLFTVWFQDETKVSYTSLRSGVWADVKLVETAPDFSPGDAKRAIAEAIRREQRGR